MCPLSSVVSRMKILGCIALFRPSPVPVQFTVLHPWAQSRACVPGDAAWVGASHSSLAYVPVRHLSHLCRRPHPRPRLRPQWPVGRAAQDGTDIHRQGQLDHDKRDNTEDLCVTHSVSTHKIGIADSVLVRFCHN